MILDLENNLSSDQVLTTGTQVSTNVIDFGAAGTPAQGLEMLYRKETGTWKVFNAQVTGTFAGAGGTSVQLLVQVDDDVAFGSAQTLYTSAAIAVATLVAGYRFLIDKLPPMTAAQAADSRYMRLSWVTVGTHTPSAADPCTVTAGFIGGPVTNVA